MYTVLSTLLWMYTVGQAAISRVHFFVCDVSVCFNDHTENQHPPAHHEGWMVSGQETDF